MLSNIRGYDRYVYEFLSLRDCLVQTNIVTARGENRSGILFFCLHASSDTDFIFLQQLFILDWVIKSCKSICKSILKNYIEE